MTLMPPLTGLNTPEVLSRLRLQDGSLLRHCQRIYKLEMQRLKWRHWNGAEGSTIAVGRSVLVDRIIEAVSDSGFREILRNRATVGSSVPACGVDCVGRVWASGTGSSLTC